MNARPPLILAIACLLPLAGCIWTSALRGHTVDFSATVVDASSGAPVPGITISVIEGDKVLFEGTTDEHGTLAFTNKINCCHRRGLAAQPQADAMSMTFRLQTREHGTMEIPVRFDHDSRKVSLGKIQLVRPVP